MPCAEASPDGSPPALRPAIDALRELLAAPDNVFALRGRQFLQRERRAFLVERTRAEAERLGERVDISVRSVERRVNEQGESINRAARSGLVGIGVLTLLCVVFAGLGMRVVN